MMTIEKLREELSRCNSDFKTGIPECGGCINFTNTPRRGERKYFSLSLDAIRTALNDILKNRDAFYPQRYYKETAWRILGERYLTEQTCRTMMGVQTKPFYIILSKITHIASGRSPESFDEDSFSMEDEDLEAAIRILRQLTF